VDIRIDPNGRKSERAIGIESSVLYRQGYLIFACRQGVDALGMASPVAQQIKTREARIHIKSGEAERMIVEGFFDPIMQRIPFEGVRERFQQAIEKKTLAYSMEK
jgi:hypothetical protein